MKTSGLIRNYPSILEIFYRIMDVGCIILILIFNYAHYPAGNADHYLFMMLAAVVLFQIFNEVSGLYRSWRGASLWQQGRRIVSTWMCVSLVLLLMIFSTKTSTTVSRQVILLWMVLTPIALISIRALLNIFFQILRKRGRNTRSVVIAGAGDLGRLVAEKIYYDPSMGLNITGFYDDDHSVGYRPFDKIDGVVLGNLDQLAQTVQSGLIDMVYITLPMRDEERMRDLLDILAEYPVRVYVVPNLLVFDLLNARVSDIGGIPAISILDTPHYGLLGLVKRLEDIVVASIAMIIMGVPMILIALGIKLTSPGPVIFKQRRYGLDGKEIIVWKFRTMTVCEDGDQFRQATQNDNRVTPLGAFLRKTSLDELPQFINVLQGRMSVVGPRPHPVALDDKFRREIKRYMSRNRVKPGITGQAQINGWRGETDTSEKMEKRVECDLAYIRDWSPWLDVQILFRTVWRGFTGDHVY